MQLALQLHRQSRSLLKGVKLSEIKEFVTDPALFRRSDTYTALRIYNEWVRKFSPNPAALPKFFEVDRGQALDPLLHTPIAPRTLVTARSPISIPHPSFTSMTQMSRRPARPSWTAIP